MREVESDPPGADTWEMRKFVSCLVALLLGTGVLLAPPAYAAFGAVVQLPSSTVYSPYGGPAVVSFTFAGSDEPTIFRIQLRRPGHGVIEGTDLLIDPGTQSSPHEVAFSWNKLSVTSSTDYVIEVHRQDDGSVITDTPFTVLPPLVSALTATPSPFYPLVQDGYKDRSRIGFSLASDTTDTVIHVFADDAYGRCCGPEIRTQDLGPRPSGDHLWAWDGTKDDASLAPRGTYFVKVEATDTNAVMTTSRAQKVEITKGTVRLTSTKQKNGSAYARVGDVQLTAIGGSCRVAKDPTIHSVDVLCANAAVSITWAWGLKPGERIESASFAIEGGYYGCRKRVEHTKTTSTLRVLTPPTSTCSVTTARITYSYPVQA